MIEAGRAGRSLDRRRRQSAEGGSWKRRTLLSSTALMLCTVLASELTQAQAWPQRPVKIVVPYPPGGNTDSLARLVGERLGAALGAQFLVENRAGATGMIGTEFVARASADGYTLLVATLTQIATAPFTNKITYDPVKDFAPISIIGTNPFVLTVAGGLPVNTLKEWVDYARARPGQLNYSSGGAGSLTHLSGALFVKRAGLEMTHVPYKGAAPALADVLAGQVQMYSASPSEVIPHAKAGKIKLLGISSETRAKYLPDVPTIGETYPGHVAETWNALFAPSATPPAVIERLSQEIQKAMRETAFLERLERFGVEPVVHTPRQFAELIQKQMALWREVIIASGIKPE